MEKGHIIGGPCFVGPFEGGPLRGGHLNQGWMLENLILVYSSVKRLKGSWCYAPLILAPKGSYRGHAAPTGGALSPVGFLRVLQPVFVAHLSTK